MQAIIGISIAQVMAATAVPEFKLGTCGAYDHPTLGHQEFVYGKAGSAIAGRGYVALEATGFTFTAADLTSSAPGASGPGSRVGVAQAAMTLGQFGWFQVYGKGPVRTLASAAKGTRLNTTATPGALDDDATASSESILGITLMTATGGAAATNEDAMLVYPTVGQTL